MKIFIALTFLFLFWAFYEFSGGADFEPPEQSPFAEGTLEVPEPSTAAEPAPSAEIVAEPAAPAATPEPEVAPEETPVVLASADPEEDPAAAPSTRIQTTLQPATRIATLTEGLQTDTGTIAPTTPASTSEANSAAAEVVVEEEPAADIRRVAGNRVNMRNGPGTNYDVVTRLVRDDEVEVLRVENGWARLKGPDGRVGWMAERLLTASAN